MKALIQRVVDAQVWVNKRCVAHLERGLLVYLGVALGDTKIQADEIVEKIIHLRVFDDDEGKMNRSLVDIRGAGILWVSQFTLLADCRKGRRPSYSRAAPPVLAKELYEYTIEQSRKYGVPIASGIFQASMQVQYINDGPVSILLDTKELEGVSRRGNRRDEAPS
ncbi:MAG: D-aminoacyl-tRNA deacylase [Treponemataceae bacterium]|nr:D-aminoacyl-tRNA deacylase [Treponemataceae bacterium]